MTDEGQQKTNKNMESSLLHDNSIKILKLLLESGADIKNNRGDNSLTFAKNITQNETIEILEEHIFQKKLLIVQKRLVLGKLFYSSLGKNMEEGLYEKISSFV